MPPAPRRNSIDSVIIETYSEPAAAHLARIHLEAHGIDAWIDNEYFTSVYPLFTPITRGAELKVAAQDAPRAAEILRQHHEDPEGEE